ncbi:MAG: PAS domain-containing protein [Bacteroidales bacterium]
MNKAVDKTLAQLETLPSLPEDKFSSFILELRSSFNELMDIDKHYQRKEYLVFPYLEKNEITGPPKVMWGKHDEIRDQLKGCIELLKEESLSKQDLADALELIFFPLLKTISDMVKKEEEILFPMSMDVLTIEDWWNIHKQTLEFGFTLYDPEIEWKPEGMLDEDGSENMMESKEGTVKLPSGSFSAEELMAILNSLPVDMTFVDKNDKVKYFSQGEHRIFPRSRSIINRDVRLCHPPGSVDIVEKIIEDFKSGKESHAPFWIQRKGKFILIEYYALRNSKGEYLGTLEVSQDLTNARELKGEQRILSYGENKAESND